MMLKWFITMSKSYMGYGKNISKTQFWIQFPRAYSKFLFYMIRDKFMWYKARLFS